MVRWFHYIDFFFTICNSYPNALSIWLNTLMVGILSLRSIREITCCLFPVNAANSFCVIFSCFRKETISPINLYSARDSSHAFLNSGLFSLRFSISFSILVCINGIFCNGVQREHNKKLNNGLPILHKVPPKRDYGRYFCIMAEKGGTSHGGLTEKLSLFFHAKKQEVNAYGR